MPLLHLLWNSNKISFISIVLNKHMEKTSKEINKELLKVFLDVRGQDYLKRAYPGEEILYEKTLFEIIKYISDTFASILVIAKEKDKISLEDFTELKKSKEIFLALISPIEYTLYESKAYDDITQLFIWRSYYQLLSLFLFKYYGLNIIIKIGFISEDKVDSDVIVTDNK